MSERTPQEIRFEADYWKAITDDLSAMATSVAATSDDLLSVQLVSLELTTLFLREIDGSDLSALEAWQNATERLGARNAHAMAALQGLVDKINALLDLVNGRLTALHTEVDKNDPPTEGEPT